MHLRYIRTYCHLLHQWTSGGNSGSLCVSFSSTLHLQKDVEDFLQPLELCQYLDLFKREGYYFPGDLPGLIVLSKDDLKKFGITKRGAYSKANSPQTHSIYTPFQKLCMYMLSCTHQALTVLYIELRLEMKWWHSYASTSSSLEYVEYNAYKSWL